jgi:hypothetical protein
MNSDTEGFFKQSICGKVSSADSFDSSSLDYVSFLSDFDSIKINHQFFSTYKQFPLFMNILISVQILPSYHSFTS